MSSNTPRRSILRASALMASGTMVSRILGFIRNAMLIAAVGATAGGVGAAFQTANTLPNTVFNLLASGIFDAVLVPQIVGAIKRRHDGDTYVNRLLTLAGTLLFLVTFATMVLAPVLVMITAAGYTEDIRNLAILFALLCLPQLFFYGLYNLLGELLNAREIFGPYMWAPVVNNVVGIAGLGVFLAIWGGAPDGGIPAGDLTGAQFWVLAGSATLGVICQALCLLWPMRRAGVSFKPDFHFRGTSFGSMPRVAGWTFATLGVSQVGVLSTNNLAAMADGFIGQGGAQGGVVGIRIENELECYHKASNQYGEFLAFRPITFVPIAIFPIVPGVLSRDELDWLNAYHREVFEKLAPRLTEDERDWLAKKCAAIGA